MKDINKGRLAFTSLLLIFALTVVIASLFYEPRARLIPLAVGIGILILGLPLLVHEVRPIRLLSILDLSLMDIGKADQSKESSQQVLEKKVLEIIAWMIAFFIVIFLVGFHIGIIVFSLTYLKVQTGISWSRASIATVIIWGLTFLLFEVALGFTMFKGLLFGELMPRL